MKKILCMLLAFFMALSSHAQDVQVSGKVVDEQGIPIMGASIKVKNAKSQSTTDSKGTFSVHAAPGAVLIISYIGYVAKEVPAAGKNINVVLVSQNNDLDEFVVVGFGTQKKVSLTGAVAVISGEQLVTTKNESVTNMLTGKLPGVRVVQKSAEPGAFSQQFDIRGFGNPLVVIDGIPRGNFERLDPNDIESISVLKDASAAVYGVQAANGVVLITTKKGKIGARQLRYEVTTGIQRTLGNPGVVGAVDWMTLRNEQAIHDPDQNPVRPFSQADFDAYANGTKTSFDWYAATLRRNAPETQHSLTATGGSEDLTYYMSLGYFSQEGFWKSGDINYNKYNFRSNLTAKLSKRLTAELQVGGISDSKQQPYGRSGRALDVFSALWRQAPVNPPFLNGDPNMLTYVADNYNPVALTTSAISGYQKNNNLIFQGTFNVVYDIPYIEGLKAKGLFAYDFGIADNKSYSKNYNLYTTSGTAFTPLQQGLAQVNRYYGSSPASTMQYSLDYNHSFGGVHNVQAFVLYEERNTRGDNFSAQRDLIFGGLDQLGAGAANNQIGTQNIDGVSDFVTKSVVSKLHYDYKSRYLIDLISRADASSRFSKNKIWGFFPAVLGAWRLSEEPFMKNIRALAFIDNIKLRGSYGVTGDSGNVAYQFLTGYDYPLPLGDIGRQASGSVFDGNFIGGVGFRSLPNPYITWMESKTLDFGLDVDLWKGLLGVQVDWFKRDRSGLNANRNLSLPGSLGAKLPLENLESDRSQGIELMLSHKNRIGNVGYNVSGNVSYARNSWRYKERAPAGNSYDNWRNNMNNRYKNIWFGQGAAGRFQSFDQIYNYLINNGGGNRKALPGDYIYEDWNGDGYINGLDDHPIAATFNPADQNGGQPEPPLVNFGLSFGLNYKGFDMDALFQGSAMRWITYGGPLSAAFPFANSNALDVFMDRWHPEDPMANPYDPNTKWVAGNYAYTGSNPTANSKFTVLNAAYVRLKTLTLGYTLPKAVVKKLGIQNARIYTNGYNLFTVTGLKITDPEHPSDQDSYAYPLNKTYSLGLSVTF